MKKIIMIPALIFSLGIGGLILTGCGGQEQPSNGENGSVEQTDRQQPSPPEQQNDRQEEEEEEEQEESLSLPSIISRASEIDACEYDITVTSPNREDHTAHMWWKGADMRVDSTMPTQGGSFDAVYLLDTEEQVSHVYLPDQNRAIKMSYSQAKEQTADSPREQNEELREQDAEITGREVINGKECVVVEYTSEEGDETTVWVWEEYGLPIRTATVMDDGEYTTEMSNIEFKDIPDDRFQLPEGVQVMDVPAGMGEGMMPSGNGAGMGF
jgi:outer membrane lipoprotein-sorting protein